MANRHKDKAPDSVRFDFLSLAEPGVILTQNLKNFRAAKLGWHVGTFGERIAQLRPRDLQAISIIMRAGPAGGHAYTSWWERFGRDHPDCGPR